MASTGLNSCPSSLDTLNNYTTKGLHFFYLHWLTKNELELFFRITGLLISIVIESFIRISEQKAREGFLERQRKQSLVKYD